MDRRFSLFLVLCLLAGFIIVLYALVQGHIVAILEPMGLIADKERALMANAFALMLIVVVPVYALAFFFAWHYRASNEKAVYAPEWEHAKMDELVWWAVPFEIVLVLSALTWSSTHDLDPYKPLANAARPPLTIQAIALDWKWLFIYPEQGVATVNYMQVPVGTPINIEISADAPMNSFWIPALAGQIYAMSGMVTKLHLIADSTGVFRGSSANYSGPGFADMTFSVRASSFDDFTAWVSTVKASPQTLDQAAYTQLSKPSKADPVIYFSAVDPELFSTVVMHYMMPMGSLKS